MGIVAAIGDAFATFFAVDAGAAGLAGALDAGIGLAAADAGASALGASSLAGLGAAGAAGAVGAAADVAGGAFATGAADAALGAGAVGAAGDAAANSFAAGAAETAGAIAPAAVPAVTTNLVDTAPGTVGTTTGTAPTAVAPGVSGTGPLSAPGSGLGGVSGAAGGAPITQAPVVGGSVISPDLTGGIASGSALNPGDAAGLASQIGAAPTGDISIGADIAGPAGSGGSAGVGGGGSVFEDTTSTFAATGGGSGALPGQAGPVFTDTASTLSGGAAENPSLWSQFTNAISPVTGPVGSAIKTAGDIASSPLAKVAGIGLTGVQLMNAMNAKNQQIPGMAQQNTIASNAAQQGTALSGYLTSGTLPPGVQTSIDKATHDAITAVKAKYASMGVPPGSTMEQQQISSIQQNAVTQGVQIAEGLLNSGTNLTNLSAQVYASLVGENTAQNNQVNQAVANLSTALAGGNKITIGGTQAAA